MQSNEIEARALKIKGIGKIKMSPQIISHQRIRLALEKNQVQAWIEVDSENDTYSYTDNMESILSFENTEEFDVFILYLVKLGKEFLQKMENK